MLFEGTEVEARAVLEAMAQVARGPGGELTDTDVAALVAASTVIFGLEVAADPDGLEGVEPAELADAVGQRASQDHVVAMLVIMALVDGSLDKGRADRAREYARALGVQSPALDDVEAALRGELDKARADMVRRNMKSIAGRWMGDDEDSWITPYKDSPDPALVRRFEKLRSLDDGTFGRAFVEFYHRNGFAFPGDPAAPNEAFAVPHDSAHVLSGYDTSVQGELLVSTYTAGMHDDEPMAGHILPVIFSWHLGIELVRFAGSATGALSPEKFWVAWERGFETPGDTFSPDWDFWGSVAMSLDDVRASLGVPPLDPAEAADGVYPDWYTPSP